MLRFHLFLFILFFSVNNYAQKSYTTRINSLNEKTFELAYSDLQQAIKLNNEALILLAEHRNQIHLISQSDVYSARGTIFSQQSDYKTALQNFHKSLDLRVQYGKNKDKIFGANLNIANCYYYCNKNKYALSYYRQCQKFVTRETDYNDQLTLYNGFTQVFESLYKLDSAQFYYDKCAATIRLLNDKNSQEVADYYGNLGQFYDTEGKFELAKEQFFKAISIENSLNNKSGLAWSYHHLGIIYQKQGKLSSAKSYFHTAEKLAVEQKDLEIQKDISNSWMLLYSEEGKQDSVNFFFDQASRLNEKVNEEVTAEQIAVAETRFKTKEQQALLKSAEERESLLIYSGSSILLTLSILSIFLIRNYRQKQRIALLNVDLKDREINELLGKQENATYAAMLEGQDAERQRIARELHDRLGSTLATVKLSLQNGSGFDGNEQRMQLVNNAIGEVREIAHDLSGGNIERYGLYAALEELKRTIEQAGKISVELYLESTDVPTLLQVPVYRIVQELVSNTLKHANATQISMQLSLPDNDLQLIYEDNGRGFDPNVVPSGMGLNNIRHRLEKWDGNLAIDSQPNRGTIIILTIPLTPVL